MRAPWHINQAATPPSTTCESASFFWSKCIQTWKFTKTLSALKPPLSKDKLFTKGVFLWVLLDFAGTFFFKFPPMCFCAFIAHNYTHNSFFKLHPVKTVPQNTFRHICITYLYDLKNQALTCVKKENWKIKISDSNLAPKQNLWNCLKKKKKNIDSILNCPWFVLCSFILICTLSNLTGQNQFYSNFIFLKMQNNTHF